ncbi:AAA family ATPase [Paraburkholderia rhizosphaerae]|uniref:Putative kinase n=1 Tax=Paraburkholderia rhizosphaerae TaxID=480658 RepID=A0A4V3HCM5_9BURK|nr:ATP-binding protein [Paraburkholderia rhizosphaerae]TDY37774.1 putative kinase [Paraburkholderia rhizosphaerae]
MTYLVFFCGHAGTGKTTLARCMLKPLMQASGSPFCLLDKDTLYGHTGAAMMRALTGDPHDRDSPLFLQHLRDPEYRGLVDTARDNLALGVSVLAVAPLSREVRERRLFDREWLGVGMDVEIRVVWVQTREDVARKRIAARGDPADAYKLAHWHAYRQRRFTWTELTDSQRDGVVLFDNTAPDAAGYDMLLQQLVEPHRA